MRFTSTRSATHSVDGNRFGPPGPLQNKTRAVQTARVFFHELEGKNVGRDRPCLCSERHRKAFSGEVHAAIDLRVLLIENAAPHAKAYLPVQLCCGGIPCAAAQKHLSLAC